MICFSTGSYAYHSGYCQGLKRCTHKAAAVRRGIPKMVKLAKTVLKNTDVQDVAKGAYSYASSNKRAGESYHFKGSQMDVNKERIFTRYQQSFVNLYRQETGKTHLNTPWWK